MVRIAIDCMGGDGGPATVIKGAMQGNPKLKDVHLLFVGPKPELNDIIAASESENSFTYEVIDAPEVITNEDQPVLAVRRKKNSSLAVAAALVKEKKADAMITTGSTGAFLAAGLLIVGRMKAIRRPALAAVMPDLNNGGKGALLLDCGANMDATSEDLVNYARMGSLYSTSLLQRQNPSIALLNVGPESKKGNQVVKDTFEKLSNSELNFIGNIEARDLMLSPAEIVICDGFAGNIAIKTFEGAALILLKKLKEVFMSSLLGKLSGAVLRPALLRLREELDYNKHGGAILLGLDGLCIKCHGSSSPDAIQAAVNQACDFVEQNILQKISDELSI